MSVTSIVMKNQTNFGGGDATATSVAHTVGVVESPMTLNVGSGQEFTGLQDAMDWIEARVLIADVTIQIADGTYSQGTTGFAFNHPNYAMVSILGNTSTPSNVTFNFSGSSQAFRVNNVTLKSLKGLKISGGAYGVLAHQGGSFRTIQYIEITGCTTGPLIATDRSLIEALNVSVTNSSASGVQSTRNSYIYGQTITSNNTSNGWGFYAEYNGTIYVNGYTATGNANGVCNVTINSSSAMNGVFAGS